MLGIENITAHNGWAMAITGGFIVFAGLSLLPFAIAQLHKIILFIEKMTQKEKINT